MINLNQFKVNALYKRVINEIQKDCKGMEQKTHLENLKAWVYDIIYYGLRTGKVSSLISTDDTMRFYKKYAKEIAGIFYENLESSGLSIDKFFRGRWDSTDSLALYEANQVLLACYAYKEIVKEVYIYLKEHHYKP